MNSKQNLADFDALAAACKALAHPARLAILQTLVDRGTCVCGEIVCVMPLSQATVSQHLKVLKEAGLISGETEGTRSCYCVNATAIGPLRDQLTRLFGTLETCC